MFILLYENRVPFCVCAELQFRHSILRTAYFQFQGERTCQYTSSTRRKCRRYSSNWLSSPSDKNSASSSNIVKVWTNKPFFSFDDLLWQNLEPATSYKWRIQNSHPSNTVSPEQLCPVIWLSSHTSSYQYTDFGGGFKVVDCCFFFLLPFYSNWSSIIFLSCNNTVNVMSVI